MPLYPIIDFINDYILLLKCKQENDEKANSNRIKIQQEDRVQDNDNYESNEFEDKIIVRLINRNNN